MHFAQRVRLPRLRNPVEAVLVTMRDYMNKPQSPEPQEKAATTKRPYKRPTYRAERVFEFRQQRLDFVYIENVWRAQSLRALAHESDGIFPRPLVPHRVIAECSRNKSSRYSRTFQHLRFGQQSASRDGMRVRFGGATDRIRGTGRT